VNPHLSERVTATVTGAVGLVFSTAYVLHARAIEDSLLADAVGASGVPVAVGLLMASVCCALLFKAFIQPPTPPAAKPDLASTQENPRASHVKAMGLLAILLAYVLALPVVGYVICVGLLAFSVAWFAGARNKQALTGLLFLTGPSLWLLFDALLKVRMPTGNWSAFL